MGTKNRSAQGASHIDSSLIEQHFSTTLLELCRHESLAKITVKQLVEAAGTVRRTFYNHFLDMDDLIYFTAVPQFLKARGPVDHDIVRDTLNFARENRHFFAQLRQSSGPNCYRKMLVRHLVADYSRLCIAPSTPEPERTYREMRIRLHCAGSVDLFLDWVSSSAPEPLDVFVSALVDSMPDFMRREALSPDAQFS